MEKAQIQIGFLILSMKICKLSRGVIGHQDLIFSISLKMKMITAMLLKQNVQHIQYDIFGK